MEKKGLSMLSCGEVAVILNACPADENQVGGDERQNTGAEKGQDTTIEIIDLFSKHESTQGWIKEQIVSLNRVEGAPVAYRGLAGNPGFVRPSQKWVCPKNKRDHWMLVIQEGEDPPTCDVHKIRMIRGKK